jgi:hypothetical protein
VKDEAGTYITLRLFTESALDIDQKYIKCDHLRILLKTGIEK